MALVGPIIAKAVQVTISDSLSMGLVYGMRQETKQLPRVCPVDQIAKK